MKANQLPLKFRNQLHTFLFIYLVINERVSLLMIEHGSLEQTAINVEIVLITQVRRNCGKGVLLQQGNHIFK